VILSHEVAVPAPPDTVFGLLNDVEAVAGCLPGAVLDGRDGDEYRGRVTIKVGPIRAAYAGTARFTEVLPEQRLIRLAARGADAHGQGDAEAQIRIEVMPGSAGSSLRIHTDLVIRGKIAQFGKGAIAPLSDRILAQFAENLGRHLTSDHPAGASGADAVTSGPAPAEAAPLNPVRLIVPSDRARKAAIVIGAGAFCFLQGWLIGQRRLLKELIRDR
jgi:carbon monoxide dehydrogenase subunit G